MTLTLRARTQSFPIDGIFTISRGAKTTADVILCEISDGIHTGRGESVPYRRYGETLEGVLQEVLQAQSLLQAGASRSDIQTLMHAGAARNAVDCALWDLECKVSRRSAASLIGLISPQPLTTAYTLSLAEPDEMHASAKKNAHRPLLKIKTGTSDDAARLRAVRSGAPDSQIIVDANEGWTEGNLVYHLQLAKECNIALIEQPLPAGQDSFLETIQSPVLLCADESVHQTKDLEDLRKRYDAVNIKLDKTGGLTEALLIKQKAQSLGFQIMVGCMVGTSLAMAPADLLAQGVEFVDLDGPLLLAEDRDPALHYDQSIVHPPEAALWG